ncbi:hypothetical protein BB2000_3001 [Proteus mirabilis BB2000]|nr:hypothetical protein BB2000_3001 [Proteus mirabilis BB2000]
MVFADFAGDFVKVVFPDIAQRDYYKGGSLVAKLFRGELWWRTNIHYPPVH